MERSFNGGGVMKKTKIIILSTIAIILIASGVVNAADPVDNPEGANAWEFLLDKFKDMYKDFGCCMPHCRDLPEPACRGFHGGKWIKKSCGNVEECLMGCCTPFCVEYTAVECRQRAGKPHNNVRCEALKECDENCCLPLCFDMTETVCRQKQGKPKGKKCEEFEECNRGCCLPDCEYVTEKECTQAKGKWHEDDACDEFDECEEVCCKEPAKLMKRQECKDAGGTSLSPSKCPGHRAIVRLADIVNISMETGEYADYEYLLDIQTCDAKLDSKWTGTVTWVWTINRPRQSPYTKTTTVPISITPYSGGNFTYKIPGFGKGWGNVSEKTFKVTIYIPLMMGGNIQSTSSGPVLPGVKEDCKTEP
jgi:hypothetical protein